MNIVKWLNNKIERFQDWVELQQWKEAVIQNEIKRERWRKMQEESKLDKRWRSLERWMKESPTNVTFADWEALRDKEEDSK